MASPLGKAKETKSFAANFANEREFKKTIRENSRKAIRVENGFEFLVP